MPVNQVENSEVGHLNLGAGRILYQFLTFIHKFTEDKIFFKINIF
ncbi:MAG: hypothetical protein Q8888_01935 [Vigna little leaf phytoplasma]|nr:hypothetical protein [Vigna little leaf phytoplasma]